MFILMRHFEHLLEDWDEVFDEVVVLLDEKYWTSETLHHIEVVKDVINLKYQSRSYWGGQNVINLKHRSRSYWGGQRRD